MLRIICNKFFIDLWPPATNRVGIALPVFRVETDQIYSLKRFVEAVETNQETSAWDGKESWERSATCALGSCRGEVGSSRRVWTFLLFRIWSSFFAFRNSTLTSALLRLSSWKSQTPIILYGGMHYDERTCSCSGAVCYSRWRLSPCSWTGGDDLRCR